MERKEIIQRIRNARAALNSNNPLVAKPELVDNDQTHEDYHTNAKRVFGWQDGKIILPDSASEIVEKIHSLNTYNTLRTYARAVRYVALQILKELLIRLDRHQRKGEWERVEKIVSSKKFSAIVDICKMLPADYKVGWSPKRKRQGKKASISRMEEDWRIEIANESKGQYRLACLVTIATGARPVEFERGIYLWTNGSDLVVRIRGAKVTKVSGQRERVLELPNTAIKKIIINELTKLNKINVEYKVNVKCVNSITTHIRNIAIKLWPKRKQSITSYSMRHAMAADCKAAMKEYGTDPDLVYKVLGHRVDKTASYYGVSSQSKGKSLAPRRVISTRPIKIKSRKPKSYKRLKKKL